MALTDIDRLFSGTINRGYDVDGTPVVWGRIEVNTGFICAMAACQEELGWKLDEMMVVIGLLIYCLILGKISPTK